MKSTLPLIHIFQIYAFLLSLSKANKDMFQDYAIGVNRILMQKVPTPMSGPSISTMINAKIKSKKFKDLIVGEPTNDIPNASREFRKAFDRHQALDSPSKCRSKKVSTNSMTDSFHSRKW